MLGMDGMLGTDGMDGGGLDSPLPNASSNASSKSATA